MSQTYQVFVRSTDIGATNPLVIAMYPDTRPVDTTTHGPGMSIYTLPMEAIQQPSEATGRMPVLVDNWQTMIITTQMASTLVNSAFALSAQIESLHQTTEDMLKYGADVSKWPLDARQRKQQNDEKWKYVDQVYARAKELAVAPTSAIGSDKAWPTPPGK